MKTDDEDNDLDWHWPEDDDDSMLPRIRKRFVNGRKTSSARASITNAQVPASGSEKAPEQSRNVEQNESIEQHPQKGPGLGDRAASNTKTSKPQVLSIDDYDAELMRVRALSKHDLDARVRLPFVMMHLRVARATVYRRIAKGHLSKPIKQGAHACWSFTEVEHLRVHGAGTSTCTENGSSRSD